MICPACGAAESRQLLDYPASAEPFRGRRLSGCAGCGLVFVEPMPSAAQLDEYYRGGYWSGGPGRIDPQTRAYYLAQAFARAAFIGQTRTLGSVLDVGAGSGDLLRALRALGFSGRYDAVEPDEKQSAEIAAAGAGRVFKTLEAAEPGSGGYGLVVLSHVLEHVGDPAGFLSAAARLLSAQGRLFIEIPNQDHLYKADLAPHLLFFSPRCLGSLLERHGTVLRLESCGQPIESLRAQRDRRPGLAARLKAAIPPGLKGGLKKLLGRDRPPELDAIKKSCALEVYGEQRQWIRALVAPARRP